MTQFQIQARNRKKKKMSGEKKNVRRKKKEKKKEEQKDKGDTEGGTTCLALISAVTAQTVTAQTVTRVTVDLVFTGPSVLTGTAVTLVDICEGKTHTFSLEMQDYFFGSKGA